MLMALIDFDDTEASALGLIQLITPVWNLHRKSSRSIHKDHF